MAADELKKRVEVMLTEAGFNRFGFAMRWNEAIQDAQFITTEEGVRLVAETGTTSSGVLHHALPQREKGAAGVA